MSEPAGPCRSSRVGMRTANMPPTPLMLSVNEKARDQGNGIAPVSKLGKESSAYQQRHVAVREGFANARKAEMNRLEYPT